MKTKEELLREDKHDFESLTSVMDALRSDGGCPWDIEQTHKSVRKCLIEETYEVIEAIDKDNSELLREELGDLLFQIMFHARIEKEEGRFEIEDVVHDITHKMIVRHPHVFADTVVKDSDEVIVNWDNIKKKEKSFATPAEVLKRVPPFMPALLRAQKVQGKALSKFSYGYKDEKEAWDSAMDALKNGAASSEKEIGKALFAICAASEMRELDLEAILSGFTDAFISTYENSASDN